MFESINTALNYVLHPLLQLPSIWVIIIIAFLVAVLSSLAYKYFTDQNLMRRLKSEQKELQKEIKTLKENPEKMMEVQKQMMQTNQKYMMQSLKPTFFTFIPLILLYTWLAANLAFMPIMPGMDFTVTMVPENIGGTALIEVPEGINVISDVNQTINGDVMWTLNGEKGGYDLKFIVNNQDYFLPILITENQEYENPQEVFNDGNVKNIQVNLEKKKYLPQSFWNGWLATYILFTIIFTTVLRKLMKLA